MFDNAIIFLRKFNDYKNGMRKCMIPKNVLTNEVEKIEHVLILRAIGVFFQQYHYAEVCQYKIFDNVFHESCKFF